MICTSPRARLISLAGLLLAALTACGGPAAPDTAEATATSARLAAGPVALRSRANGLYVSIDNLAGGPLIANRTVADTWETFALENNADGTVSLRNVANGAYVSVDNASGGPLMANRAAADTWEKFRLVTNADGTVSLQSAMNGLYVCAENAGASLLVANRGAVGAWEAFTVEALGTPTPPPTPTDWPAIAPRSDGKWVRVRNTCPFTVWVHAASAPDTGNVVLAPDDQPLAAGASRDYLAPNTWTSARVTAYGDGPRAGELEKVEMTFGGGVLNYNVTYVDWVGLPMEVTAAGGSCTAAASTTGCYAPQATLTSGCPEGVLRDGKKCLSPRTYCANPVNQANALCHLLDGAIASCASCPKDTTTNVWMCAGLYANEPRWCAALNRGMVSAPDDPDQSHYYVNPPYSTYSRWVHEVCPDIYAFPYDDWLGHGGFRSCSGDEVRVTFCPKG
jgi:Beta-1,3-glucanase/Ricin-type beta-trefoil lectin domain-like